LVTKAWRERFNQDTQQLISAHRDLLNTTAALTTDGVAGAQTTATEAGGAIGEVSDVN